MIGRVMCVSMATTSIFARTLACVMREAFSQHPLIRGTRKGEKTMAHREKRFAVLARLIYILPDLLSPREGADPRAAD